MLASMFTFRFFSGLDKHLNFLFMVLEAGWMAISPHETVQLTYSFLREISTGQAEKAQAEKTQTPLLLSWLFLTGAVRPLSLVMKVTTTSLLLYKKPILCKQKGVVPTRQVWKVELYIQERMSDTWYYVFIMPLQETWEISQRHLRSNFTWLGDVLRKQEMSVKGH